MSEVVMPVEVVIKIEEGEYDRTGKPTIWTKDNETYLVDIVARYKSLHPLREQEEFGPAEMDLITRITYELNVSTNSGFDEQKVLYKWCEIRTLFEIKYVFNGYKMDDQPKHILHPNGTIKDDLTETWHLYFRLAYLEEHTYMIEKERKKEEAKQAKLLLHAQSQKL